MSFYVRDAPTDDTSSTKRPFNREGAFIKRLQNGSDTVVLWQLASNR